MLLDLPLKFHCQLVDVSVVVPLLVPIVLKLLLYLLQVLSPLFYLGRISPCHLIQIPLKPLPFLDLYSLILMRAQVHFLSQLVQTLLQLFKSLF